MHSETLKSLSSVWWWWFLYTCHPALCCPHSLMLTWTVVCPFAGIPFLPQDSPYLGAECAPIIRPFDFCIPRAVKSRFIRLTRRFNKENCVYSPRWGVTRLIAKLQNTNWENATLRNVWPSTLLSFTYTVDFLVSCFLCGNPENSLCPLQAPGYSELSPFSEKKAFLVLPPFKHPAFGFMRNVTERHKFYSCFFPLVLCFEVQN